MPVRDFTIKELVTLQKASVHAKRAADMLTDAGLSNSDALVLALRAGSAAARELFEIDATECQKFIVATAAKSW